MPYRDRSFINRELSWLEFNQRVLDQALYSKVPVLDRLKFLAITASNMDEFFMVRVGGLQLQQSQGVETPDPSGLSVSEQLEQIFERVNEWRKNIGGKLVDLTTRQQDSNICLIFVKVPSHSIPRCLCIRATALYVIIFLGKLLHQPLSRLSSPPYHQTCVNKLRVFDRVYFLLLGIQ